MNLYLVFVTFPFGILGQLRCLLVLVPDLCNLSYYAHFIACVFEFFYVPPRARVISREDMVKGLIRHPGEARDQKQ